MEDGIHPGVRSAAEAAEVYRQRRDRHRRRAEELSRRDRALGWARLGTFLAAAVLAWMALIEGWISLGWTGLVVVAFFLLLRWHDRVISARQREERLAAFHQAGLHRLDGTWPGRGSTGSGQLDPEHPYAIDLDLFGEGSLFERLSTCRTTLGEETLGAWLKTPADPGEIRLRQGAVAELAPRLDLREDLVLLGEQVERGVDSGHLLRWGGEPPWRPSAVAKVLAVALSAVTLGTALAPWLLDWGWSPLMLALLAQIAFGLAHRRKVGAVVDAVEEPGRELAVLAGLLERLEAEPFESHKLVALRRELEAGGVPPSQRIARLGRLVELLDARRNQFFAPFAGWLFWSFHLAGAIEAWRAENGPALSRWLAAAGELEALVSFAAYAFESPGDTFPEILPGDGGPRFDAEGLVHPLLPGDEAVRNDVALGEEPQALVVSGSNMSGKSTLLRSVGVATAMALAGAPVKVRRLALTPLALAASIRVQDSLLAGTSRFYAEIRRLKQVVERTREPPPVLFLLDEILHGTNSHDRRIGGQAVVRTLVEAGALGLVTTHDLALARMVDALAPRVANVHFRDTLVDGQMEFDYRLHGGVVRRSNALALMRAVGLEVAAVGDGEDGGEPPGGTVSA